MEDRCIICGKVIPEGGQICSNCVKETNKQNKTKRKEFLEAILDYCEYWKDKPDAVYGLAFSILAMCDGCSSANDFEIVDIKGISQVDRMLHDDFCKLKRERNDEV